MELDRIDRAILRLLQANARQTNAQIGESVGLSSSACHRRIRQLEAADYIAGYTIVLGKRADRSQRMNMIVQVTLERQSQEYLARFESAVRRCPEIKECFLVAGAFDYWLRVEADNAEHYETIHGEILSRLPGVTRLSSNLIMRDAHGQRR